MTQPAKEPKRGNRFTGSNMTAREAQTLVGCMRKMRNMMIQMDQRDVYVGTRNKLAVAYQQLVDTILAGNRLEEIPRQLL